MIICGCAMEAQYQLRLTEQREHKPIYITDRIGKYTRRRDKNNGHKAIIGDAQERPEALDKRTTAYGL